MIEAAIEQAKKSTDFGVRVGAVVTDKKGRVISVGYNRRKTHPVQKRFADQVGRPCKVHLHAEISALVKCRQEPHTMYVARIQQDNNTAAAHPCPICVAAIEESGIKKVVYTTEHGHKEMKLESA